MPCKLCPIGVEKLFLVLGLYLDTSNRWRQKILRRGEFEGKKYLVRDTANSPFVNHKGKDLNSDWFADQSDERSVLEHAQFHKGKKKGNHPEIDTAQTPKCFNGRLAPLEKI